MVCTFHCGYVVIDTQASPWCFQRNSVTALACVRFEARHSLGEDGLRCFCGSGLFCHVVRIVDMRRGDCTGSLGEEYGNFSLTRWYTSYPNLNWYLFLGSSITGTLGSSDVTTALWTCSFDRVTIPRALEGIYQISASLGGWTNIRKKMTGYYRTNGGF